MGFPSSSDGRELPATVQETWFNPGFEDPRKKGMATHSSVLAGRITRTEEPEANSPWVADRHD